MHYSDLDSINGRIFNRTEVSLGEAELREVEACYRFLEDFEQGKVIYGINTGFGPMAQYRIGDADLNSLQYNIIRSHSCGAGEEKVKSSLFRTRQRLRIVLEKEGML